MNPTIDGFMSDADQAQAAFKARVETFLRQTGMPASQFGIRACRDKSFVPDMRSTQREFRPSTIRRVEAFMQAELAKRESTTAGRPHSASREVGQAITAK
jgi:hypothetical protein